jgi:AcrR family transcriptional regulator
MSTLTLKSGSSRAAQKLATRSMIISTAKQLFLTRGYDATTTRHIADEAGVAIGTVFAHFPDKDHLLREILSAIIEQFLCEVRPTLLATTGAVEALLAYANRLIPFYLENPDLSRTLLRSVMFDQNGYSNQLHFFVAEIAERLELDAPGLIESSRQDMATVLVANYLFSVIGALGNDKETAETTLADLRIRCCLAIQGFGSIS